jgi:protein involved in polysaccharide export with SLBB domain
MYESRFTTCDWRSVRRAGVLWAVIGLNCLFGGCNNKVLDPSQIGRFRPTPAVNVILGSLGVAEETPVAWESAEEPRPKDVVAQNGDYALRPGDLVQITIFELYQEGVPLVNQFLVSETGKISIPEVGVIQAAGLTETQLENEIKKILSPNILKEPAVTVILVDSQQRTFSILGNGVQRPGRFLIPRYDFRLTDALATAGGPMQFNVSYVYVSRKDETSTAPAGAGSARPAGSDLELIKPGATLPPNKTNRAVESAADRRDNPASGTDELRTVNPQDDIRQALDRLRNGNKPSVRNGAGDSQPRRDIPEPCEPAERFELEREMLDLIAPSAQNARPTGTKAAPAPAPAKENEEVAAAVMPHGFRLLVPPKSSQNKPLRGQDVVQSPTVMPDETAPARSAASQAGSGERIEWVFRDGKWIAVPIRSGEQARPQLSESAAGGLIDWVLRDGQWVPVAKGQAPKSSPVAREPGPQTLPRDEDRALPPVSQWDQGGAGRLLRIPTDKLLAGDSRYNLAIKPGDTIYVPVDIIGEFLIMGNVNRTGAIPLTGRPFTLKMAIAAAGGLGPLASPKNVEVIRRIGRDKEEIVMVDLDRIASGEQPDFFIKPYDLINVGTEPLARWRAILRNAFRATYGFGFVYDRNFADVDYGQSLSLPHWF